MMARHPSRYAIAGRQYYRFLFQRWKLVTFAIAATLMTAVAPYSGDPTWDYTDGLTMSALTFWTAPWSIGTLARTLRFRPTPAQAFVALGLWLFSASLSYDLYLWLRDGIYPDTSQLNLVASSGLYLAAGLFWNLQHRPGRIIHFAFLDPDWPTTTAPRPFRRIWPQALLVALLVALLLAPFFWNALKQLLTS
jgi:hypothetical protein